MYIIFYGSKQYIFFLEGGRAVNFSKPFLCFLSMFEKRYQICHMPAPYAVLYVTIRWFTLVNIFLINSVKKLYFLPTFPTFSTIIFLRLLWRQPFLNISASSHLQISNTASLIELEYMLKCRYPPQKRNVQLAAKVKQYYFPFSIYPYTSIQNDIFRWIFSTG